VESIISEDGHDARNNGNCDSGISAILDPLEEEGVVEEELRNDEVSTSIHLFL
jgi:hypothetical protein